MGILNSTPNSFYDGGKYSNEISILNQVEKMLTEGATFIDIGAYSSKPSAEFVSEEEEISRLIPMIQLVLNDFPDALISVDTFRANVAKAGIQSGDVIISFDGNTVSGYDDLIDDLLTHKPDDEIHLVIMRQGPDSYTRMNLSVTLGENNSDS